MDLDDNIIDADYNDYSRYAFTGWNPPQEKSDGTRAVHRGAEANLPAEVILFLRKKTGKNSTK